MNTSSYCSNRPQSQPVELAPYQDMVWIPGGEFYMGSDDHYPEEAPQHRARVDGFWMDRYPITNERFSEFVDATGYVTFAEIAPSGEDYPDALPGMLRAGSLVFTSPAWDEHSRAPGVSTWWHFVFGADWRHPTGPESNIDGLEKHPVVHVAWPDVEAWAMWAGKELPSEAEWEFAARGGLDRSEFAWVGQLYPNGNYMANTWQGEFPWQNLKSDGYDRTSPVDAFPPNDYGLFDMIGNVWEWTADWYAGSHAHAAPQSCCAPQNPRGTREEGSYDPSQRDLKIPRKVLKGGSHLCAPNYCRRYRPAARFPHPVDTSTSHVGFRCIVRRAA